MVSTVTAFLAGHEIARGEPDEVAQSLKERLSEQDGAILVFEDRSGHITDLNYREAITRGVGRPRLGVQSREVTLLPRHWEWLSKQPNGASAALRRLVEDAVRKEPSQRERRDAAYRFMQAACGDMPEYEEALRALYAAREDDFNAIVDRWPNDIGRYISRLLGPTDGAEPCE